MTVSRPEVAADVSDVVCSKCNISNHSDRRFCAKCGSRLWEPCGSCGAPNSVEATFCGKCGVSLIEEFTRRHHALLQLLEQAEQLRQRGDYLEAVRRFQRVDKIDDTRLAPILRQIDDLCKLYEEERLQKLELIGHQFASARRLADQHDYAGAQKYLLQIPESLRDAVAQQLLADVKERLTQIATLRQQIKHAHEQQDFPLMLARVTQLLKYRPLDDNLQRLHMQLKQKERNTDASLAQQAVATAKKRFLAGDYEGADALLSDVSLEHLPQEVHGTFQTMREVAFLEREVKQTPFPLAYLETCLARLDKLRSQDPRIAAFKQDFAQRRRAVKPNTTLLDSRCESERDGQVKIPLSLWHGIAGVDGAAMFPLLKSGAYRFHVAYGLALQGLGMGQLDINLLPKPPGGLLKRITSFSRSVPITRIWGLDIGTTGLKAVELNRAQPDGNVEISNVQWVPHATSLGEVENQAGATEVIKQTLSLFAERLEDSSPNIVLGFSGPKTLGRWFDVPHMDAKKTADAVAYEAKMQIPIPIDDINYGWHAWANEESDVRSFQNVILLAARKDHISQQLDLLDGLSARVVAVQSVCLALYNAAVFELLKFEKKKENQDESITTKPACKADLKPQYTLGVLDLGAESSNLVAVSPRFVRYRSMPIGTQRLDRELMRQLQLSRTQSEELRLHPERTRCLYQVEQVVCSVYEELLNDLRRTIRAYETSGVRFDKLVVTGGGVEQLGVLRMLLNN